MSALVRRLAARYAPPAAARKLTVISSLGDFLSLALDPDTPRGPWTVDPELLARVEELLATDPPAEGERGSTSSPAEDEPLG